MSTSPAAQPPDLPELPPEAWGLAHRAARMLVSPLRRFFAIEAASGLVLLGATLVALVWANSPWHDSYHAMLETPVGLQLGDWGYVRPLHFWINDVLMTVFFFVVGLEIRREIHGGELSELRRAALPLAAALGGMLAPAALYVALNQGRAGAAGWGIPMATDIAFAVGVLTVLGRRVPGALRVLLLALAVIDDIGAIIVIAVFYTGDVQTAWFGVAGAGVGTILLLQTLGVRYVPAYAAPAIAVWIGLAEAGIHPTLAGVIVGLLTPARTWYGRRGFTATAEAHLATMREGDDVDTMAHLDAIDAARREAVSPAENMLHHLHPWVALAIMPLFALANAGVAIGHAGMTGDALFVFLGIIAGLVLGKPIGIALTSWLATGSRLAVRPRDVDRRGIAVVGMVGGIGFTMSLFIAQLALTGPLLDTAKLAILIASAAAIIVGLVTGVLVLRPPAPGAPAYASVTEAEQSTDC